MLFSGHGAKAREIHRFNLEQCFLTMGNYTPPKSHLAICGHIFDCHDKEEDKGTTGICG